MNRRSLDFYHEPIVVYNNVQVRCQARDSYSSLSGTRRLDYSHWIYPAGSSLSETGFSKRLLTTCSTRRTSRSLARLPERNR